MDAGAVAMGGDEAVLGTVRYLEVQARLVDDLAAFRSRRAVGGVVQVGNEFDDAPVRGGDVHTCQDELGLHARIDLHRTLGDGLGGGDGEGLGCLDVEDTVRLVVEVIALPRGAAGGASRHGKGVAGAGSGRKGLESTFHGMGGGTVGGGEHLVGKAGGGSAGVRI